MGVWLRLDVCLTVSALGVTCARACLQRVENVCLQERQSSPRQPSAFHPQRQPLALGGLWSAPVLFRYLLLPFEEALSVKAVALRDFGADGGSSGGGSGGGSSGGESFLAVGTAEAFGEDYPALGRVLLFQVGGLVNLDGYLCGGVGGIKV